MSNKIKPVKFPRDEFFHDAIIEWWYFNGHLKDRRGHRYAFMNCLFKADVKKAKIPLLSRVPVKTVYFAHSIVTDIENKRSYPRVHNMVVTSNDSFSQPLLLVNYTDPIFLSGYINSALEEVTPFSYHVKTVDLNLQLHSLKKPLLEGGKGYVTVCGKGSYYYSLTNLKTKGTVMIDGKPVSVTGKCWMDHQWGDVSYSKDKWSWFSIQLDHHVELMCCEYDNGKEKSYIADIVHSDGRQENVTDLVLSPIDQRWTSPETKAVYPLEWIIDIPSKAIQLRTTPLAKKQELIFGSITYWEGPIAVNGNIKGKKVQGVGFMELVGYPSKYTSMKYVREQSSHTLARVFELSKNAATEALKILRKPS